MISFMVSLNNVGQKLVLQSDVHEKLKTELLVMSKPEVSSDRQCRCEYECHEWE